MILSKKFWQEKTTFFIIMLLLFSALSIPILEVKANTSSFDEGLNNEDGVYYISTFEEDNTSIFGGAVIADSGNKITLDPSGSRYGNYNFTNWNSDSANEAYRGSILWFSPFFPKLILTAFENKVTTANYYWAMSKEDQYEYPRDGRVVPSRTQQFHHFRFEITQELDSLTSFEITWKGSADNHKMVKLYAWNQVYGAFGVWQEIGNRITNETEIELYYENESLPLDEDGFLDFCVVVVPELGQESYIQTDYVNVRVKGSGYASSGSARFNPVIPENISRWETFQWSGYSKESATSIDVVFFDYDDGEYNLISNTHISGNSAGITNKKVDLSNLPKDTNLTVNVRLSTTDLSITPELYDWGVSWQISDDYWMDQFSTDLRVDESTLKNIRISDGKAHLVTTVYDWPMQGHNAQNTRVSPGMGPGRYNTLCWESLELVGGNQKNPIVNDGLIYIANQESSEIYAFDAQYDNGFIPNEKVDASGDIGYDIKNSPLATSKNTIVVATGESNENGDIENKVFGLNANDLQTQDWTFSYRTVDSEDPNICFESSPVIDNNNIYLTSWNGDSSLLTDVFDFLNLSKGNNKLICLTDGGSHEWSADLASGSFSSPAVGENRVVAGCEKRNGESLRAFTLDGTKVWGQDVGPIGYASPVIDDNTVYVVSKQVSQTLVSAFTQVLAVNINNGNIKWNTTIGDILPESYRNAATTSPVVVDGYVYVVSPDGYLYKIDDDDGSISKSVRIYNKGVSSQVVRSSPAYADGMLYIGTPDGYIKVYNAVTLEEVWKKSTDPISPIYCSPIIVDGFVYYCDEAGFLYCRGKQQISDDQQITGELISDPISLPDSDLYWDNFRVTHQINDGYIKYSILNKKYQVLIPEIEDNEDLDDDDVQEVNTIRLKAEFHANAKEIVTLDSWKVNFKPDHNGGGETIFRNFEKNLTDPPIFIVYVRNEEIGLINDSARFKLEYSNESTGTYETDWLHANFSGENETTEEENITVNMSYYDFSREIDMYHKIRFSINDTENDTTYSRWYEIQGVPDEEAPIFYLNSFTPDPPYISTTTPTCSIQAQDAGSNGNTTGINVASAEYTIDYNNGEIHSSEASCTGNNGTKSKVTITADISESSIADDITSIDSIRFSIEDEQGNRNQTSWIDLFYDNTPPESSISNSEDIPQFSNDSFILINATANDPDADDEFTSGVKDISLYYRKKGTTQWLKFESSCSSTECSWQFTIGNTAAGEYEACSIALDNASNEESFPEEGDVFFTYDPNPPRVSFSDTIINITNGSSPPTFNQVTFEDDYQLDRIYYRLNSDGINNWTLIINSNKTKEIPEWSITEEQFNDMIEDEISYVFFKVTDALGNTYTTPSTNDAFRIRKNIEEQTEFTLDTTDFDSWRWDNTFMVRVNTQNATVRSMTLWYRYAGEDQNTSANWTKYDKTLNVTPFEWSFIPEDGEGYYQFYVEIIDAEGLQSTTDIETEYINLFPFMELIIAMVVLIILFIISGLVIKKYQSNKKKKTI